MEKAFYAKLLFTLHSGTSIKFNADGFLMDIKISSFSHLRIENSNIISYYMK